MIDNFALNVHQFHERNRIGTSCDPIPLATNTIFRFAVSVPIQSNAPPSMSGTSAPAPAAAPQHEAQAVVVAMLERPALDRRGP